MQKRAVLADWELVGAYRDGDASAFVELVKRHSGLIASICRQRSSLSAQDVIDETWFRVLLRIESEDVATHRTFPSWVGGIALNVLQAKSMRAESGEIPVDGSVSGIVDPAEFAADIELHEALHSCLEQMDARLLDAYRLHYVEELPYVQVARRLNCSEANVRQKLIPRLQRLVEACLEGKGFRAGSNLGVEIH